MSNIAELYRKQQKMLKPLVSEIRKHVRSGDCVIDLGCGTCPYFSVIQKCVGGKGTLILTDIDRDMIRYCKKEFAKENVRIKKISAEKLSSLKVKADAIIAGLVIQFTEEKKTLAEAKKSLKENGILIFAIPLYRNGITIALDRAGKLFQKEMLGSVERQLRKAGIRQKASFGYVNDREARFRRLMMEGSWKVLRWSKLTLEKNDLKHLLHYYRIPWRSHRILKLPFEKRYKIITNALKDAFGKYPKFIVDRHYLIATARK